MYEGIYEFKDMFNGKRSWVKDNIAIRYYSEDKRWCIGDLEDVGNKCRGRIYHSSSTAVGVSQMYIELLSDKDWSYKNEDGKYGGSIKSGDIDITCATGRYFQTSNIL